ncbi:MAG: hypothetical protein WC647_06385 [Desulfomonilaceae bacterium]|jgi:hypothetical protein
MTTKNYALTVMVMLIAVLLTNFGLFIAPAISYESVEQGRTACLSRCNNPTGGGAGMYFRGGGGSSDSLWRLRSICISNCEKKYWKEWQKEMDEIGQD